MFNRNVLKKIQNDVELRKKSLKCVELHETIWNFLKICKY